jgi:hypothetical protein
MTSKLLRPSTIVGSGLLLMLAIHCFSTLRSQASPGTNLRVDAQTLPPGTDCTFTASLPGTIHEITDQSVVFSVSGLEDHECGVPIVSKQRPTDRLFKNVGVARAEARFLLEIPRQRLESLTVE